jgi:hypothetical protein
MKDIPFYPGHSVLVAGDDVEHADPILDKALAILGLTDSEKAPYKSPLEVAEAVDEAFGDRLSGEIERRVLRKRGFTAQTFLEKGKEKCTPSVYLSLCSRIDQISIKLKFLVCGFDNKGFGHIYCVDGEHSPANYNSVGMWAIGSGAHAALSSMAYHKSKMDFSVYRSVEEAAYFGIVAKFMAESSDLVGKVGALVCAVDKERKPQYVNYVNQQKIRAKWEKEGAPRVPSDVDTFMKGLIAPNVI